MHYIFLVTVNDGYSIEQYAESWTRASELIQRAPGAQGTRLHRMVGDERRALAIAPGRAKPPGMPPPRSRALTFKLLLNPRRTGSQFNSSGSLKRPSGRCCPTVSKSCDRDMPAANRALVWAHGGADRRKRAFPQGASGP